MIGPLLPKAGTQIHPERLGGFTWAPAFETGLGSAEIGAA
jgi:hypothetical protein